MSSLKCLALFASSVLVGTAAISAPAATVIHACYNKASNGIRIVAAASDCRTNEQVVSWNEEGPAGPPAPKTAIEPALSAAPGSTTIPANLIALSKALSTNGGVAFIGNTSFRYTATNYCMIGDVILSVNGYGQGALPADGRLLPINQYVPFFPL